MEIKTWHPLKVRLEAWKKILKQRPKGEYESTTDYLLRLAGVYK